MSSEFLRWWFGWACLITAMWMFWPKIPDRVSIKRGAVIIGLIGMAAWGLCRPVTVVFGLFLLYGIPAVLVTPVWWAVARLNKDWEARAFMDAVRAKPAHVHVMERLLRTAKPKLSTTLKTLIASIRLNQP